jgi:hypothetical protein
MILEGGRGLRELSAFMLILVGGWEKILLFLSSVLGQKPKTVFTNINIET